MTTRRELFPYIAGAAGPILLLEAAAPVALAASAHSKSEPQLRRVSYKSARTGKDRDYFVYLPPGHATKKDWPVMLFLHGNGERGDGKGDAGSDE